MHLTAEQINVLLSQIDKASSAILDIYKSSDLGISTKKDNSPLTLADKVSNQILTDKLKEIYPAIPILSEEGGGYPYELRKTWKYFWLLDPLDGTKEFISGNGEFTINLALIKGDTPLFGIVCAPTRGVVYFAQKSRGSYKKETGKLPQQIKARIKAEKETIVARSRSHKNKRENEIIEKIGLVKTIHAGSALKFCLVAEGTADIYLRGGPTMEWDTAAGQCIAENAGALTFTLEGNPFLYNKPSLLNPGLICTANKNIITKLIK
ncbi:MAG: 3'(2'),5'-bisphosphate nucleotidase CysQ [Candidatus Omnitrophica bacterium]|nr:3'(2'),5'-bisphosphate nucleotidase CysQ [Candidatus Omnitrophota bacterium]MBD3268759.1 3'(2'),5'-bisphosphate nucleotidase CysQ [Candidatus Omnitrophota bacterium]